MKYKTDEAIREEFNGFKILSIEVNKPTGSGAISGYITVQYPNGDEHVGGGAETVTDNWIDYDGDGQKIAFENWIPDDVYYRLCDAIRSFRGLTL